MNNQKLWLAIRQGDVDAVIELAECDAAESDRRLAALTRRKHAAFVHGDISETEEDLVAETMMETNECVF